MPVNNVSNRFISHRINLFEPDLLFSINCLSFNSEETKLAVLRRSLPGNEKLQSKSPLTSHSAIEIWDCSRDHRLTLGQTIYDDEDDPCLLESLGWSYDDRLWACGLNGRLHELDLINSNLNQGYPLISGAGWCLKFSEDKTLVAVGTEEGYICVFNVAVVEHDKPGIDFVKTLSRDQARILSLAWYEQPNEVQIVSGSIGVIKIWNYETGSCLSVIKASEDATIFWCLTIIDDFTIVSGDSNGNTIFWDGRKSTLINSIPSHKADVLCLTRAVGKRCLLYSAGVDPSVITFNVDSNGKGVQSATLNIHSHDVRSLVFSKEWLISGGFDCYLTQVCAYPQKQVHQAPVFNHLIHIRNNRMLFQCSKSLEIWEIGSADSVNICNGTTYQNNILTLGDANQLPLTKGPAQIAKVVSKRLVHQSNFSGPWVAYSILEKIKILYCSGDNVTKVPMLCDPFFETITGIQFIDDKYLLLSTGLKVYAFKLAVSGIVLEKQFKYKHRIHKMTSSNDYIALALDNRSIVIISVADWSLVNRFKASYLPSCLAFNPYQKDEIWFGFSNHLINSYAIQSNEFTKHSFNESNQYLPLIGLTFHPNGFISYDQDRLYHYNGSSWTSSDRYSHLAKVEYLPDKQELLVIEITPNMIKRNLPIRFSKKKFGT